MHICDHFPCAFDCPLAPWNQDGGLWTWWAIMRRYVKYLHDMDLQARFETREDLWWLDERRFLFDRAPALEV